MCDKLDTIGDAFLRSRKNANNLIDIIAVLEEETDKSIIVKSVLTLEKIFLEVLAREELSKKLLHNASGNSAEEQYQTWLQNVYEETCTKFTAIIGSKTSAPAVQFQALDTMTKLLAMEGKHPPKGCNRLPYYFPTEQLKKILLALLSEVINTKHLIAKFQEFSKHSDATYYIWKLLPSIVDSVENPNEVYLKNFLQFMDVIALSKTVDALDEPLCGVEGGSMFTFNINHVNKWMNKTWQTILKWQHTPVTQRKMLIILLEKYLANLKRPLYLTDHFMNSLDSGGPISVLALQGMLTLIQTYNLDYPNIYSKLYSMIEAKMFQMRYKPRLFHLADLFLTSSHLPLQLVAAFAKRMARLTLVAPPQDIHIMLQFIGNLIIRHPALKKMLIACPSDPERDGDPFNMCESDPMKSQAMASFLWEVYSLQQHYLPSVANAANQLINSPMPTVEWDIGLILEITEDQIFLKEYKKKPQEINLTYEKPFSVKLPHGEKLMDYWSMS